MIQQFHSWVFIQKKINENTHSKRYMHHYVHCNIIYTGKIWKQPKCPSLSEWIKM